MSLVAEPQAPVGEPPLSLWKVPGAAKLALAQLITQMCDKMVTLGFIWVITKAYSDSYVAWFVAAGGLPHLLLARYTGGWVSRLGLLRTVVLTDLCRGALFALAFLWARQQPSELFPALVGLTLLTNTLAAFFNPAVMSLPPRMTEKAHLSRLTAMINSSFSIATFAGPALAAVLYHAVTAHPLSQKALSRAGLQSTGCLLSYARGELFESELASHDLQRESTLLMYRPPPDLPDTSVRLCSGPALAPFADLASQATGQRWEIGPGCARSALPAESRLSVQEVPALGTAILIWHSLGQDLGKAWRQAWEGLLSHGIASVIVLLDWEDPGCESASEAFLEEGLVPVGTLPGFAFARPLIMIKLAPQTFDIDQLQISCPLGLRLREAIAPWLKG